MRPQALGLLLQLLVSGAQKHSSCRGSKNNRLAGRVELTVCNDSAVLYPQWRDIPGVGAGEGLVHAGGLEESEAPLAMQLLPSSGGCV